VAIDAGLRWSEAADVYMVDGGDALPMDAAASATLYVSLADGGWLTGSDTIRRLQGLQLIGPDDDPADYYARAQADKAARDGRGLGDARELLEQLRALESGDPMMMQAAEAAHEAAEAPEVETAEEEAEAMDEPTAEVEAMPTEGGEPAADDSDDSQGEG
jgi:hypothetical protein